MPLPDWLKSEKGGEIQPPAPPKQAKPEPVAVQPEVVERASVPLQPPTPPEPPQDETPMQPPADPQAPDTPESLQLAPNEPEAIPEPAGVPTESPTADGDQVLGMLSTIEQKVSQIGDQPAQDESGGDDRPTLADIEEREAELQLMRKRVTDLEAHLKESQEAIESGDEMRRSIEAAQTEIADLVRQAEDTHRQLQEKSQEAEQARGQNEALTAQLAAAAQQASDGSLKDDAQELIDTLNQQIMVFEAELAKRDEALAEAQQQQADEDLVESLNQQIATLTEELKQRDQAITDLRNSVAKASTGNEGSPGGSNEMIERQRLQIERLTEQVSALSHNAEPKEIQERDARITELEEELEQAKSGKSVGAMVAGIGDKLKKARKGKGGSDVGDDEVAEKLKARVLELTNECESLRTQAGDGGKKKDKRGDSDAAQLRARVQELETALEQSANGADDEAQSRIRKLEGELESARARSVKAGGEVQAIQEQQDGLQRQKSKMAKHERKMIKKWARQKSVVVYCYLAGLAVIGILVSSFAVNHFFPATIAASVNLQAKKRLGGPVPEGDAEAWLAWHTARLTNPGFHNNAAKRLRDRGLHEYGQANALGKLIENNLSWDSPVPTALTITLAGTDRKELPLVLDTLATSLAQESSHNAGSRGDGTIAVVRGERRENGQVKYASINAVPIKDQRLMFGAAIFGVVFFASLIFIRRIYSWLLRTKSVMEENDYNAVAAED